MEENVNELRNYTTEQLKAELKRRADELKAEKNKIKRCRMCKHWGEINYWGKELSKTDYNSNSKCCKYFTTKTGKYYRCHYAWQPACEHFEEITNN